MDWSDWSDWEARHTSSSDIHLVAGQGTEPIAIPRADDGKCRACMLGGLACDGTCTVSGTNSAVNGLSG